MRYIRRSKNAPIGRISHTAAIRIGLLSCTLLVLGQSSAWPQNENSSSSTAAAASAAAAARQPVVLRGAASELVGDSWLNTPKNAPVTLASRRGKVTILHFWTFG